MENFIGAGDFESSDSGSPRAEALSVAKFYAHGGAFSLGEFEHGAAGFHGESVGFIFGEEGKS